MTALAAWTGEFGDTYTTRNMADAEAVRNRTRLWARILERLEPPKDILEIGAGSGTNLRALRCLTDAYLVAVEPNAAAREALGEVVHEVYDGTAQNTGLVGAFDLVFTSGVLIHIPPDHLDAACGEILRRSRRYVCSIEYFANDPEEKEYRGEAGLLWKRDFGQLWLDRGLRPVDCGFAWRPMTGLDNLTWWVFEK